MKKLLVIGCFVLVCAGCGTQGESVSCTIGGKSAVFELKNGIVSSYTFDGEKVDRSKVDEINGEYFTSATNNEEGKEALNNYVTSLNGTCEE